VFDVYAVPKAPLVALANKGYTAVLVDVSLLIVAPEPLAVAQTNADPFHCKYVDVTVGATTKLVAPAPVLNTIRLAAPPATFVAVVALVAVAALPPIDKPEAVPVKLVPAPENVVAVIVVPVIAAAAVPPIAGGEAKYVLKPVPETVLDALKVVKAPVEGVVAPTEPL
jgi:hypothetical protein